VQHWIFGYGIGHWQTVGIDALKHGFKWFNKAHNDLLQGLFEMGIFFPILLSGYMYSIKKRVPDFTDDKYLIPVTAIVIVLINCSVHFLFQIGTTALIAVTWVGIMEKELNES
jgi:O-antigen ligase